MKNTRRLTLISLSLALCLLLSGCMPALITNFVASQEETTEKKLSEPSRSVSDSLDSMLDIARGASDEESVSASAQNASPPDDHPIGSAKYLAGRSIVINIFLDDKDRSTSPWSSEDMGYVREYMAIAIDFIESEAERYGRESELIFDEEDLYYYAEIDTSDYSDNEYASNDDINDWIEDNIDVDALIEKYDTDSVAFMLYLNDSGISYCMPFVEGDDEAWYYEKSYMYFYDIYGSDNREPPATYAHELLHQFGAVDVYDEFIVDGVTMDVVRYIEKNHPMEIMYTTYTEDGGYEYGEVSGYMGNITAYSTALIDDCEELDMFPTLFQEYPACFVDKSARDYWDSVDMPDGNAQEDNTPDSPVFDDEVGEMLEYWMNGVLGDGEDFGSGVTDEWLEDFQNEFGHLLDDWIA